MESLCTIHFIAAIYVYLFILQLSSSDQASSKPSSSCPSVSQADSSSSASCSDRWMSEKLCFELSSSGTALVKRRHGGEEEEGGANHQNNIDAAALKVVTLIKELNREEVVAEFFLHLLQVRLY